MADQGLLVGRLPFLTQLNLRVDPAGAAGPALAAVLGAALPVVPCTSTTLGERHLLWLGPDEWLVLAPPGAAPSLTDALREAVGTGRGAVTDVSAKRTAFTAQGAR